MAHKSDIEFYVGGTRRVRMCYMKQWRRPRTRIRNLLKMGASKTHAIPVGIRSKGPWRLARTYATQLGMNNKCSQGIYTPAPFYHEIPCGTHEQGISFPSNVKDLYQLNLQYGIIAQNIIPAAAIKPVLWFVHKSFHHGVVGMYSNFCRQTLSV